MAKVGIGKILKKEVERVIFPAFHDAGFIVQIGHEKWFGEFGEYDRSGCCYERQLMLEEGVSAYLLHQESQKHSVLLTANMPRSKKMIPKLGGILVSMMQMGSKLKGLMPREITI